MNTTAFLSSVNPNESLTLRVILWTPVCCLFTSMTKSHLGDFGTLQHCLPGREAACRLYGVRWGLFPRQQADTEAKSPPDDQNQACLYDVGPMKDHNFNSK